jgi:hypothetical protein
VEHEKINIISLLLAPLTTISNLLTPKLRSLLCVNLGKANTQFCTTVLCNASKRNDNRGVASSLLTRKARITHILYVYGTELVSES